MTSTSVVLAPVLIALAFTLEGCIFSPYKPSVLVSIGKQCDAKVDEISDDEGLKDILGGAEGCGSLDDELLKKFNVDDCATVLHEMVHFALAAECEFVTAWSVSDTCPMADDADVSGASECLAAVTDAVDEFEPIDQSEEDSMTNEPEASLGLVQECATAIMEKTSEDSFKEGVSKQCDPDTSDMDSEVMEAMQVEPKDCKQYLVDQFVEIGTIACFFSCMYRDDTPESSEDATYEWMQTAVKETVDSWFEEGSDPEAAMIASLPDQQAARLRLFAAVRRGSWAEIRRRPWTTAAIAISASVALAFCALVGVAWRCLAASQSRPQGVEPILQEQAQLEA